MSEPVGTGPVDVAVIVVNFASSALLERNLATLSRAVDVIVVDNWSGADERTRVLDLGARHGWDVVDPPSNTGFGGGCNLGAARALERGARVIVLLNPDASIEEDGLAELARRARADPLALVAPRIVTPSGRDWSPGLMVVDLVEGLTLSAQRHAARPSPQSGHPTLAWLSGACLALTSTLWAAVEGFDEEYFLYWEDVDLSLRVQRSGGRLTVAHDVIVVHDEGATHRQSSSGPAKSPTYYYYSTRNRLLFADKHLDAADRRRWRRGSASAAVQIVLRGGRRQFLESTAPWTAPLRGTLAGLRRRRA